MAFYEKKEDLQYVWLDTTYRLEWLVRSRMPVVNVFKNPDPPQGDGTEQPFPEPNPTPAGVEPVRIEITVERGPDLDNLEPDFFLKNRNPPTVIHRAVGPKKMERFFSATFEARVEGAFVFRLKSSRGDDLKRTMIVQRKKHYRTIQEVIDDPTAVRRQAIVSAAAEIIPAFNTSGKSTLGLFGEKVGTPSKIMGQGNWASYYPFPQGSQGTSCVVVNPLIMRHGDAVNSTNRWSFNVGPIHWPGNPAWFYCTDEYIPSVGDTYIALNPYKIPTYGHVGLVLHVPKDGNGLWVTADGGQGRKPRQLGVLVPRWGLMGANLPPTGNPPGQYPDMVEEPHGGPFLSGASGTAIDEQAPNPTGDSDIEGIIARLKFKQTHAPKKTSNPRRIEGFADVDSPLLTFQNVDGKPSNSNHIKNCELLRDKINNMMAEFRSGKLLDLAAT
ncbi:CHAP domain-containing protein [Pseudenhygromyxa sp. WMMC2535]|uniref:CHAP domain-containing protein n=1 Tax=Pseudenhygromyxa sp. WMMC2535 TaxID=2712867 RepID=UPI001552A7FF|nr:CHAP domain-containing protein [Pseudenhygromyxa sp. WMMC2535]NVB42388.1 CHAP domain-containing protein [Pseudenhygromyxa sp. WMMC2535]